MYIYSSPIESFEPTASYHLIMPQQAKQIPKDETATATKKTLIIWVPLDEGTERFPAQEDRSSNIHWQRDTDVGSTPWLQLDTVKRIRGKLGAGYASFNATHLGLQQGVLTAEILQSDYPYCIQYEKSPDAALKYISRLSNTEKKEVVVWLDVHQEVSPSTWAFAYDLLEHECGRIFPPREEIIWADSKVYDIMAFDQIAAKDRTCRPQTCYLGSGKHDCLFPGDVKSILKRSHSCGNAYVKIVPEKDQVEQVREEMQQYQENDPTPSWYYRWMHQQYVSTLIDFGEFRVFVATKPAKAKQENRML
jgi:hypothetical protein